MRVVATERAIHFLEAETPMPGNVELLRDSDEWSSWQHRGDPVMHIDLMKWADILVLAPISANTLAKVANVSFTLKTCKIVKLLNFSAFPQGLCDNLATCVARAWPVGTKHAIFCPAMNTRMWEHPVTAVQVDTLKKWGYLEVPCIAKTLVCGDKGLGAMAEVGTIVDTVLSIRCQQSS